MNNTNKNHIVIDSELGVSSKFGSITAQAINHPPGGGGGGNSVGFAYGAGGGSQWIEDNHIGTIDRYDRLEQRLSDLEVKNLEYFNKIKYLEEKLENYIKQSEVLFD